MRKQKYGKSFKDIASIKEVFFQDNRNLLKNNVRMAEIYKKQPRRTRCKNCNSLLNYDVYFTKQNIDYYMCACCNHLNGAYEDTDDFASAIYVDEITSYSKTYTDVDFDRYLDRVNKVYKPKAEFLINCLEELGIDYLKQSYSDLGAGSGYFVYALNKLFGVENIRGYEVSKKQVELANHVLNEELIHEIDISGLQTEIQNTSSRIISMIGVLEHLTNPRDILSSVKDNPKIEFFYLSLPLFSYSVFFELVNQDIFNRHLSGGHTHLYTIESIEYFCKENELEIVGQWQFGTDFMDLYRFMQVRMNDLGVSNQATDLFADKFTKVLDELQKTLDKQFFSSEVHVLLRKKLI